MPGISAMVVDAEPAKGRCSGKEGLLLVNGPNRMAGYLGEPELTGERFRDGWYVTGDIASIDEHGFIRITDRLSRFSKIAGEMVPHMKVEEELQALLHDPHTGVVTAVPDAAKGERLVALHTIRISPASKSGSGCRIQTCRSSGCRSARTSATSNRSRRSAPARSIYGRSGSVRSATTRPTSSAPGSRDT
jgi:acyl-coenzyme A synthetase/AMP-(fatty) acid ligase